MNNKAANMKTNIYEFSGSGPYEYSETKSAVVGFLYNPITKNYLFYLKSQEYGPVIVDSDFESGKTKIKKAFEKMLVFKSLLSLPEAKQKVEALIKEVNPSLRSDIILKKSSKNLNVEDIAENAKKKLVEMVEDVDKNLVIQE